MDRGNAQDLDDVHFEFELPRDRPLQVIGFGENAVDWVCRVPYYPKRDTKIRMERLLRLCGGQIATACCFLARLGVPTRYVGRVGDDDLGRFVRGELAAERMDLKVEIVPGAASHQSLILVDRATGGRTILYDRDPGLQYGEEGPDPAQLVEGCVLHVDANDIGASIRAAARASEAGMLVSVDIDHAADEVHRLLAQARLVIAGRSFLADFGGTGDWRRDLERVGRACPGFVAVTRGAGGAAALWQERIYEFPGFSVQVVDSTGAGDMFHGAFIFGVLQGWSVGRCMRFANAAGALACTRLGARPSIPTLDEILAFGSSK